MKVVWKYHGSGGEYKYWSLRIDMYGDYYPFYAGVRMKRSKLSCGCGESVSNACIDWVDKFTSHSILSYFFKIINKILDF